MTIGLLTTILLGCVVAITGTQAHAAPAGRSFYVDAKNGRDAHAGTSPKSAWQSIERVNKATFAPGDTLYFVGGQRHAGTLHIRAESSGASSAPVIVTSSGTERATVDGGVGSGIVLDSCSHVALRNLSVLGCGRKQGSDGIGIRLLRTHNVEVAHVDVAGFRLGGVVAGGDENTRLTHIHAHDNGAAGIMVDGGYEGMPRSRNLYIGDCIAANNPGDPKNLSNHSGNGIVVGGVDGALIEYCEAMNNGWDMPRDGNGPVGIWGWNSDRLIIQHCISHDNKSPGADGGGFDFDGGVTNSVMQYNLSYNNVGCGYLLCQYGGAAPWKNNIVRYNISVNDGSKNFQAGIGLWLGDQGIGDASIYNNTIVNPVHAVATLGDLPRFVYRNNIFLVGGDILHGPFTKSRFENNLFWSTGGGAVYRDEKTVYATLSQWAEATEQEQAAGKLVGWYIDPRVTLPPSGWKMPTDPRKLETMPYYRLASESMCVRAGLAIPNAGATDFFGNRLLSGGTPSLGAHEAGADRPKPSPSRREKLYDPLSR